MVTKQPLPQKRVNFAFTGRFQAFIGRLKAVVPTKSRPGGRQKAVKGLKTSFLLKGEGVKTKMVVLTQEEKDFLDDLMAQAEEEDEDEEE